ncbi:TLDc domain-containing protein [Entamoeba marina]
MEHKEHCIKIQQITNNGIINFNGDNVKIENINEAQHSTNLPSTINYKEELKTIEEEIAQMKEKSKTYQRSLDCWVTEEAKEIQKAWAIRRNAGFNQYLETLGDWVNKSIPTIVYDSNVEKFNGTGLFNALKGQNNIMFIIETDAGNVFGSYHSKIPLSQSQWIVNDPDHFVFSLKNPFTQDYVKFTPIQQRCYPLWIYNSEVALYCVQHFCHISNNKQCYINSKDWSGKSFEDVYNDTVGQGGDIFTNLTYPKRFGIKRVVCINWK